jgi:hypothetical protein
MSGLAVYSHSEKYVLGSIRDFHFSGLILRIEFAGLMTRCIWEETIGKKLRGGIIKE